MQIWTTRRGTGQRKEKRRIC